MATRFRKIKKWGNSFVIVLQPTDMDDLGWKEGDELDLEDVVKKKKKK